MCNLSYLLDECQIGQAQKKLKNIRPSGNQKIVSEFIHSENQFELHPKVSELASYTHLAFFPGTHGDLDLFNLITGNSTQYNPLIH